MTRALKSAMLSLQRLMAGRHFMATLTVRNLDEDVVRRLRIRAAEHGRSAEAEHREILRLVLADDDHPASRLEAARRLAEFRQRTAGRGSSTIAALLAESRDERTERFAGPR
jgi:antitoxin FitA